MKARVALAGLAVLAACRSKTLPPAAPPVEAGTLVTGRAAMADWRTDTPGARRLITPADLPRPGETESVRNPPRVVARPKGARPNVPPGFEVTLFASDLDQPRMARFTPSGDLFLAESEGGRIQVLRADGSRSLFAEGLKQPFGIAFYPPSDPKWVYVANTDAIVRFAYQAGDVKARAPAEEVYGMISGGGRLPGGGHWSRDIAFSRDGTKLYYSVGSRSNVDDGPSEDRRARVFELTPEGKNERVYATGIRNAVGIAVHPDTGALWVSVNERDALGDDLVPDYITSVKDGGFYGWPWFYIGGNEDPRHAGKHPELRSTVLVPDILLQAHSASLGMTFYTGKRLPESYRGAIFAAEHGSWNRAARTGYKVITAPLKDGRALGEYADFMTGFVTSEGDVWGRPVAVAFKDDTLYVTDDAGGCVWRVAYKN